MGANLPDDLISFDEFRSGILAEANQTQARKLLPWQFLLRMRYRAFRDSFRKLILRGTGPILGILFFVVVGIYSDEVQDLALATFWDDGASIFAPLMDSEFSWMLAFLLLCMPYFVVVIIVARHLWSQREDISFGSAEILENSLHPNVLRPLLEVVTMFKNEDLTAYYNEHGYRSAREVIPSHHWERRRSYLFCLFDPNEFFSYGSYEYFHARRVFFDYKSYKRLTGFSEISASSTDLSRQTDSFVVPENISNAIRTYVPEGRVSRQETVIIRGLLRSPDIEELEAFLTACLERGLVRDSLGMRLSLGAILFLAAYRQAESIAATDKRNLVGSFETHFAAFQDGRKIAWRHLKCLVRFHRIFGDREFGRTRADAAKFLRRVAGSIITDYKDFLEIAQTIIKLTQSDSREIS